MKDPLKEFDMIYNWVKENLKSVVSMNVVDVSDVTLFNDYVAQYEFSNEGDSLSFKNKWKQNDN